MGLAAASALVVLVASGVAINRIASDDGPGRDRPQVASAPIDQGSGSVSTPDSGAVADEGVPSGEVPGTLSSAPRPSSGTARRAVRPRTGSPASPSAPAATSADPSTGAAATGASPSGQAAAGPHSGSGGSSAGEQPPSGGQEGPGSTALVAASVSAGQGDQGGVVGVGFGDSPDADVTVGTTQVVGDAPPSSGTAVGLGGGFFHPPPTIPILPG